jgi:hypothetical protein
VSLNSLAKLYRGQGKYAQAEPLFERSMSNLEGQFEQQFTHMSERDRLLFLNKVSDFFPTYFWSGGRLAPRVLCPANSVRQLHRPSTPRRRPSRERMEDRRSPGWRRQKNSPDRSIGSSAPVGVASLRSLLQGSASHKGQGPNTFWVRTTVPGVGEPWSRDR